MDRTRQYMLARNADIFCIEEPPAPGGGNDAPPEGDGEKPKEQVEDKTPDEDGDEDGNDFESLPDWAKSEIKKLRKGEAKYRTSNKELQDALSAAKSQDDIDAAVKSYEERNAELEVELATAKHTAGFTPEQLALVHGKTPEEIEESANKIRAAFAAAGDDGAGPHPGADGGRRPGGANDAGLTPRERAAKVRERSGRRRR